MLDSQEARKLLKQWFEGEERFFGRTPAYSRYSRVAADWPEWPEYQAICEKLAEWVDTLPDTRFDSTPLWVLTEGCAPFCGGPSDLKTWRAARLLCTRVRAWLQNQPDPVLRLDAVRGIVIWPGSPPKHAPICLEANEADVLKKLVSERAATIQTLRQTECGSPHKVLRRLLDKCPALKGHIVLPGGKGQGGYATTIELAE